MTGLHYIFIFNMIRLLLLLSVLIATHTFLLSQQHPQLSTSEIAPGHGYSSDKQQMSPLTCFNVKYSPYAKSNSVVRFDQGTTYS